LHHYFVLNFCQKFVGKSRVKNLFYRDGGAIEETSMDNRKTALADLFCYF
jgi:hypothetical protein